MLVGGRRRLGRALAEDLARDHDLVLTSSRPWEEAAWVEGLSKTARIQTLEWSAEDPNLVSRMMADLDTLGSAGWVISGAILVAGTFPEGPFGSWTPEALEATWRTNLGFPLLCAQALAPRLEPGSCLQILLDTAIHRPWLRRLPYSAAKAGLASLVPGLARQLARTCAWSGMPWGRSCLQVMPRPPTWRTGPCSSAPATRRTSAEPCATPPTARS